MSEPLAKKRKLDAENKNTDSDYDNRAAFASQLLREEFDLEIALRRRLVTTIESRVTWALILQEALTNDITSEITPGAFEAAALEASDVIEAPCNILFDLDATPPDLLLELQERSSRSSTQNDTPTDVKARSRKNRAGRARAQPQSNPTKLLYIRNTAVTPPTVAKMVCPDCGRSDFTNMQGLFNHTRLGHRREYGGHDECMQACAVVVEEGNEVGEREWVLRNGIELGGVSIPSLRRLFEIAVGEGHEFLDGVEGGAEERDEDADVVASTYLSRTLGHHKDTPALAPFLGRAPKKRCINTYDEDQNVDIDIDDVGLQKTPWQMSFPHRSSARPELDIVADVSELLDSHTSPPKGDGHQPMSLPSGASGTRFHILARVIISDRSVWIPLDRRPKELLHDTHRWSIGVDSPSYSLHISAFLKDLTVTCITNPPPPSFTTPLSVTDPPFTVSGATDKPFLAKVKLSWAGNLNPPMEVEHWVELDSCHTALNPVLGDEQILDVELDKHTELMPIRSDRDVQSKLNNKESHIDHSDSGSRAYDQHDDQDDPSYVKKLWSLLSRYPMTLRDVKGRALTQHVPYILVTSPAQFLGLVPGRRKAIEWARARSIRDAYQADMIESSAESMDTIPLTTGDVYQWLEDEGQFPRPSKGAASKNPPPPAKKAKGASSQPLVATILCSVCGLNHQHNLSAATATKTESATHAPSCSVVHNDSGWHKMSMLDVRRLLGFPSGPTGDQIFTPQPFYHGLDTIESTPVNATPISRFLSSSRDLVAIASPELITAMKRLIQPLSLSHFEPVSSESLQEMDKPRAQVEAQLAPYALLASLTECFVGLLVNTGMQAAALDLSVAAARSRAEGRSNRKTKQSRDRLLTPSHVIRGLASVQGSSIYSATSLCLTPLGICVSESFVSKGAQEASSETQTDMGNRT